jgi:hypothetical protein
MSRSYISSPLKRLHGVLWDSFSFIYECVYCYNRCHSNAVEGYRTLWNDIYECMFTTLDFPVIIDG